MNKKLSFIFTIIIFILTGILALSLRWVALHHLDSDNDESIYSTHTGTSFALYIKEGNFRKMPNYRVCYEHPPLIKLIYGIGIYLAGIPDNAERVVFVSRFISAMFSVFHAFLIFLISPIGSILFALDSWQVFYSSKAWLDSIATFLSSIVIWALWRTESKKEWNKYVFISALGLGIAFAAKYINFVTGFVVLYFLLTHFMDKPKYFIYYAGIVLLSFFVFDPNLWSNPVKNLWESVSFHQVYSGSFTPAKRFTGFYGNVPLWQEISFLWTPTQPWQGNLVAFHMDKLIFVLGFLGVVPLYRRSKLLFVWFIATFLFILLYPIKWPHYTLVFIPALSVSAGLLIQEIYYKAACFIYQRITKQQEKERIRGNVNAIGKIILISVITVLIITVFNKAKKISYVPNLAKAHNGLGSALFEHEKYDQAEKEFIKAIGYNAEITAYAHLNLGRVYIEKSQLDKAEKELMIASSIDPGLPGLHRLLSETYLKQGKIDKAAEESKLAGDKNSDKSAVSRKYFNTGVTAFEKGDYDKAIEVFKKSLGIDPDNFDAHNNLGVIFQNQNRLDEAETELKKAIQLNNKSKMAYRNLGVVYAKKNKLDRALEAWQKTLEIDPDDWTTKSYIEKAKKMMSAK